MTQRERLGELLKEIRVTEFISDDQSAQLSVVVMKWNDSAIEKLLNFLMKKNELLRKAKDEVKQRDQETLLNAENEMKNFLRQQIKQIQKKREDKGLEEKRILEEALLNELELL